MRRGTSVNPTSNFKRPQQHPYRIDSQGRTAIEREQAVYNYIRFYAEAHLGNLPSLRTLATALDIASISSVNYYIKRLVANGKLKYLDGFLVIEGSTYKAS